MVSSLLDELPCLLAEVDELSARLAFYLSLVFTPSTEDGVEQPKPPNGAEDLYALRGQLAAVDVDAIARHCTKHLLVVATTSSTLIEKLESLLPPPQSDALLALETLAAKLSGLMKRVYQWQQTAWEATLLPFFAADSSRLSFERHRLLTSLVLSAVAKAVKLHLLWASHPQLAGVLVLHTYFDCKKATRTKDTSDDYRPLDFAMYFHSNPLVRLQQEIQQHPRAETIATNLLELVLSCFDCYVGVHDLAHLKLHTSLWDVDASTVSGTYASSPLFHDLVALPQLSEWVLCVALCLPHHWQSAAIRNRSWQLWDFVQLIAQDRLVLCVARATVVNIHDLLFQQLHSALASGGNVGKPLQPLKRALAKLSKRTVQCAGERRRERRVYVLWFLRDSVKMLRQNGALAAPLLPRLLAVLSLAREELEWMLGHRQCTKLLPATVKPKHLDRAMKSYTVDPSDLTELLALFYELRVLVESEKDCVSRYYLQFIARGDADAIAREINRLQDSNQPTSRDDRVAAMLQSFGDCKRFQLSVADPGFASWRREWHQLSVYLLMSGSAQDAVPTDVTRLLERACRHADYVQEFDRLISTAGSLSKCFWFHATLDHAHHDLFSGNTSKGNVMIVPTILNALVAGRRAVDELAEPVEVSRLKTVHQGRVIGQTKAIGEAIEHALDALVAHEEQLHEKLHPTQVIERLVSPSSKRSARQLPVTMLLLTPGAESRLLSAPDAATETAVPIAQARERLSWMVANVEQSLDVEGGADPLAAIETVKVHISKGIERFLRGLLITTPAQMTPKTAWREAVRQWLALVRCLQHQFPSSKRLTVSHLIAHVLKTEREPAPTDSAPRLIDRIIQCYTTILQTQCIPSAKNGKVKLIACPVSNSYVHNPVHAASAMDPCGHLSPAALSQLKELIGARGVEHIRERALSYLATHVKSLFASLERDKIALIRLKLAFPNDPSEIKMAVRIMEALDAGIVQELMCVGNGVFFLDMFESSSDDIQVRNHIRQLWRGESSGQLATHAQAIWNLLPWAFVAMFYGSIWDKSKYLAGMDATTTNVHLVGNAMPFLVHVFEPKGKDDAEPSPQQLRRVAYICGQAVLSLRHATPELPTPAMLATAKRVLEGLARGPASSAGERELATWLPDLLDEMGAVANSVGA